MTTPRIDELRRLEAAATPGPWANGRRGVIIDELDICALGDDPTKARYVVARPTDALSRPAGSREADAALIAAARNALPLLLDVVEWVEAVKRGAEADPSGWISTDSLITGSSKVLAALDEAKP